MTKKDLENLILKQDPELDEDDVKSVTDLIFERIKTNLANGIEVSIPNFGKFKIVEKSARLGKNPKTGETIQVSETRGVRFANSKTVKEILNEK
jgi:nucleoid DNA-binding protein